MMTATTPGEISHESLYALQTQINGLIGRAKGSSLEKKVAKLATQIQVINFVNRAANDKTSSKVRNNIIKALIETQGDLEAIFDRQVAPVHNALKKMTTNPEKYTLGSDLEAYRTGFLGIISRFIAKFFYGVSFEPGRVNEQLLDKLDQLQGPFLSRSFVRSPKEEATKQMIKKLLDSQDSVDSEVDEVFGYAAADFRLDPDLVDEGIL